VTKRLNIVFDDHLHLYKINGEHVASVTQILGNTVPKQLQYWGYRLGLKAAEHLLKTRSWPALQAMDWQELEAEVRTLERSDQELHLSPNRARDDRGDEGEGEDGPGTAVDEVREQRQHGDRHNA